MKKKLYLEVTNKNLRKPQKIQVEVELIESRSYFGRNERLIRPVSGFKEMWVDDRRLKIL